MEKILWLAIGYLFGSFQSGYFLGKAKGIDVRNYGSHSTGATNSLRVMGTGAGVLVLLLDAAKAIIPCLLARHIFAGQPIPSTSAFGAVRESRVRSACCLHSTGAWRLRGAFSSL